MSVKLYTPVVLGLTTELADYPFNPSLPYISEARSQSCGSAILAGFEIDGNTGIGRLGMTVSACAMGQAGAAIFARHAVGKSPAQIVEASGNVAAWLAGAAALPHWPDLHLLDEVRNYPARHGAVMLSWRAASEALCNLRVQR
ncbi:iron-sulfur cluster assembly scaffold protein [Altererythrobacter aquiaggeris]|uniref:iron-sulfur cluster assembly scaffold protein n=1 Tax=Aestuarierythrobacter aquiaggeris TaxID=1898396 RepID=UPI003019B072